MTLELSDRSIERIAQRVANILSKGGAKETEPKVSEGQYISTREAASMLRISSDRMRHLKDKFPHIKAGDNEQGKLLFLKSAILEYYVQ